MELLTPDLMTLIFSMLFGIVFTAFVFKAVCFDPLIKEVKALRKDLRDQATTSTENVTA